MNEKQRKQNDFNNGLKFFSLKSIINRQSKQKSLSNIIISRNKLYSRRQIYKFLSKNKNKNMFYTETNYKNAYKSLKRNNNNPLYFENFIKPEIHKIKLCHNNEKSYHQCRVFVHFFPKQSDLILNSELNANFQNKNNIYYDIH